MKRTLLFYCTACAVLFTSCTGLYGKYDLHKTLALVMIIFIIVTFFVLAIYSNMLRDEVNDTSTFPSDVKAKNPFSLSRVQFAVWTVIISCSYIYLEFCRGGCDITDINQTALILMGIGAGVTTAGTIIDKREIQSGIVRHQNAPSDNFFADILSDNNGISIPRVQNVVWTIIAMIVYVNKVYMLKTGCALPELSDTILALTGVSGATYLVVKSQENTDASQVPVPATSTTITGQPVSVTQPQANFAQTPPPVNPAAVVQPIPPVNPAPAPQANNPAPVAQPVNTTNTMPAVSAANTTNTQQVPAPTVVQSPPTQIVPANIATAASQSAPMQLTNPTTNLPFDPPVWIDPKTGLTVNAPPAGTDETPNK
jgi:hypothetical protein